jgi:hypothetical protein
MAYGSAGGNAVARSAAAQEAIEDSVVDPE